GSRRLASRQARLTRQRKPASPRRIFGGGVMSGVCVSSRLRTCFVKFGGPFELKRNKPEKGKGGSVRALLLVGVSMLAVGALSEARAQQQGTQLPTLTV